MVDVRENVSAGIRSIVTIPSTAMSSAITMNVYSVNCPSVHEPHGTADVRMREMHSLHWEMP